MASGYKTDPIVAKKLMLKAGLKPLEPYKTALSKWKCIHIACGKIVYPRYADVSRTDSKRSNGCVSCGRLRTAEAIRHSEKDAVKLMLKAGLKPLEPYRSALKPWKCECTKCRSIVYPKFNWIQQGSGGCKKCGYEKRIDPKKYLNNDAKKIMLKAGLKPLETYKNSRHKWKCRCLKCEKISYPMLNTVIMDKSGCIHCGRTKSGLKRRTTQEIAIDVMLEAGYQPLNRYSGNHSKWKSKCLVCNKISYPNFSNVKNGSKCIYCIGMKVDEKDAVKVMLEANLKPLEPYIDNKTKWKSMCLKCEKLVYPKYNGVQLRGTGCPNCATVGMNLTAPSYLYLIKNETLNAYKVGIANVQVKKYKDRLHQFKLKGWEVYKVWKMETGFYAMDVETEVFQIIRKDKKISVHLSKEQMPRTGGHSETMSADSITLLELEKIIKKVIKSYRVE